MSGNLLVCWQDSCRGRWLPPRARHCKDCRKCRLEYDHCCPWFGPACIARDTLKAFIIFLLLAPLTIVVGLYEVMPVALAHVKLVKGQSWSSQAVYSQWWDRWYSWIGGPLFRLGGGILLSYRYYELSSSDNIASYIPAPSIGPLFWSILGSILAILTFFLFLNTVKNVLSGVNTLDIERAKIRRSVTSQKFVWIPDLAGEINRHGIRNGSVIAVPRQTELYNFGRRRNWERLFGVTLWKWVGKKAVLQLLRHFQNDARCSAHTRCSFSLLDYLPGKALQSNSTS